MPGASSDAATSTDDIHLQGRPLCVYYFSEPFCVLSASPPRASPPPAMSPGPGPRSSYAGSSSSRPSFDLGAATVHARPLQLASLPPRDSRDTLSSSLFASDVWFDSSSGSRGGRRLPPLVLPAPAARSDDLYSSDDVLPAKCRYPVKFSLPPISLPLTASSVESSGRARAAARRAGTGRRALGVRKSKRRARRSGVRRMLTCLMQRTVRGGRDCRTPALQELLATIREAWPEPRSLRPPTSSSESCPPANGYPPAAMRSQLAELSRPGASPGLLRRRYSVPETIMRKYRLSQLNSEGDDYAASTVASHAASPASPPRGSCSSLCGGGGGCPQRHDRELMRKSALLRRMWGSGRTCGCLAPPAPRSLDSSRAELHCEPRAPLTPLSPPWSTAKRQRLASPDASHGSDEMLRAAMRNSFERSEHTERRTRRTESSDAPLYDSRTSHSEDSGAAPASSENACRCAAHPPSSPPTPALTLSRPAHIDVHVSEAPEHYENEDKNVMPYVRPPETPTYELLEIVISETVNSTEASDLSSLPALKTHSPDRLSSTNRVTSSYEFDIDEYVSHILVESLNSLTDQIESMNASIVGDRKISIVEKEIKVKLQNTGVNTIVHLSPTSNHQIIFGNEELCNRDEECQETASTTEHHASAGFNNNQTVSAAGTPPPPQTTPPPVPTPGVLALEQDDYQNDNYVDENENHDHVNQAVLQQIQKLFQEELLSLDAAALSHVEVSNVDVYVAQNSPTHSHADTIELRTQREPPPVPDVAGLGAGNYYESSRPALLVPRRTALPHSASMEVNTSSSSDNSLGSCGSLVDSLDDPASPRVPPRRPLARSAVDVLELLPEGSARPPPREPEAFFIRIDDECGCDGGADVQGGVVADRMPEGLRERLLRRQRRRELRAQCARHRRAALLRREHERQRRAEQRRRDQAAAAALDDLLDDIIHKVAQDELKCLRIKHKPTSEMRKSSENLRDKRLFTKSSDSLHDMDSFKINKNGSVHFNKTSKEIISKKHRERFSKLSLPPPPSTPSDSMPRRLYQKSEIHDGNKCIEILEILEYVETSPSSSETTNSDDNQYQSSNKRKSRIPIPIYEKLQRIPKQKSHSEINNCGLDRDLTTVTQSHGADDTSRLLASMLLQSLQSPAPGPAPAHAPAGPAARRASVPEPRSRSNSLRFRRVFDIIPEEKGSLSIDSPTDDSSHNRRLSEPATPPPPALRPPPPPPSPRPDERREVTRNVKHASTSPLSRLTKNATTSPLRRSAGAGAGVRTGLQGARAWLGLGGRKEGPKEQSEQSETISVSKSAATQYEPPPVRARSTVRTIEARSKEAAVIVGCARAPALPAPPPPSAVGKKPPERRKKTGKTKTDASKRRSRDASVVRSLSEPGGVAQGAGQGEGEGGSSSESGSSLLCALAPRWLARAGRSGGRHGARRRRDVDDGASRHTASSSLATKVAAAEAGSAAAETAAPGGWSVTVAGAGRAALPSDLQMRLSFPPPQHVAPPSPAQRPPPHHHSDSGYGDDCRQRRHPQRQICQCHCCTECLCLPPAHALTSRSLAIRKQSIGSSVLGDKSSKRPELPAVPRAARSQRSVKMRRGCSPHCWLPDTPLSAWSGASEGQLSVVGAALVPRRKPRLADPRRAPPLPEPRLCPGRSY